MTAPELASTDEGTLFIVIHLPWPWPPVKPMVARQELKDGYLLFEIGVGDKIKIKIVRVSSNIETTTMEALTGPIQVQQGASAIVMVLWQQPNTLVIEVNGHSLASAGDPKFVPAPLTIEARTQPSSPRFDFSDKSAKALTRRKGHFIGRHLKPDDIAYLFESLAAEAAQMKNLLELIQAGEVSHARGLSARLRLLLLSQGQTPVLQTAAAARNFPLIVYTVSDPTKPIPLVPNHASSLLSISSKPTNVLFNPVDLDVWLRLIGMQIGRSSFSNEKIIANLGNTLGAHLDLNVLPSVVVFRSMKTISEEAPIDSMVQYLTNVGRAVLDLSKDVISLR